MLLENTNIIQTEALITLDIMLKPNSIIVLLRLQNKETNKEQHKRCKRTFDADLIHTTFSFYCLFDIAMYLLHNN